VLSFTPRPLYTRENSSYLVSLSACYVSCSYNLPTVKYLHGSVCSHFASKVVKLDLHNVGSTAYIRKVLSSTKKIHVNRENTLKNEIILVIEE
jgi:hypothetical protein